MSSRNRRSFTLIEILVAVFLGILVVGSIGKVLLMVSTVQSTAVVYQGNEYRSVPDKGQNAASIALLVALQRVQKASNAIYVIGGDNANPFTGGRLNPMMKGYSPASFAIGGLSARRLSSSFDFINIATPPLETTASPEDLSIIFIGGENTNLGILQSRRYEATITGKLLALYEVQFVAGGKLYEYRFFLPKTEDKWAVRPGAYHNWIRADQTFKRNDERSCTVVLPDPVRYAGRSTFQTQKPISRLTMELPVAL